jgi:hypothetical protein
MRNDAYPKPVASGGLTGAAAFRSLRGPPATSVRQPDLGGAPRVSAATGFGTGGGAYVRNNGSDADQSQGIVVCRCGLNPAATGTLNLTFPGPAPTAGLYWIASEWATFVPTTAGQALQLAWTATRTLVPNETVTVAYQWTTST